MSNLKSDMPKETTKAPVEIFLFFKRRRKTIFHTNLIKTYIYLHLHIINTENHV